MSWAEGREKRATLSHKDKLNHLRKVNGVLKLLAEDDDFHEDLKLPMVKKAMAHWTREKVLSPSEAEGLGDDGSVMSVLKKIQMLQHVCLEAGVPANVPLSKMMSKDAQLGEIFESGYLGIDKKVALKPEPKLVATVSTIDELPKSQLEQILGWGKEPHGTPGFKLWKTFIRSLIDTAIFTTIFFLSMHLYSRYGGHSFSKENPNSEGHIGDYIVPDDQVPTLGPDDYDF